jgi:hypothetical protein
VGREGEGRPPGVAVIKGEWDERGARVKGADVAQQSVAPEPPPRNSHFSANVVRRPGERGR